jgi:hypothetical protein
VEGYPSVRPEGLPTPAALDPEHSLAHGPRPVFELPPMQSRPSHGALGKCDRGDRLLGTVS